MKRGDRVLTFFLLAAVIMTVSILLLHRVAIFWGCPIRYKPLILCAVMAFLVNFATLNISPFLTPLHYGLILTFVLIASLGVTIYNTRLSKKERSLAAANIQSDHADDAPVDVAAEESSADDAPVDVASEESSADDAPVDVAAEESSADDAPVDVASEESSADDAPVDVASEESNADDAPVDVAAEESNADDAPVDVAAEESSADDAPVDVAAEESNADDAPVDVAAEESNADDAPVDVAAEESSADDAPVDVAAEESSADDAPVDVEDLDIEPAVPPSKEDRQRAKEELKELTEVVGRLHSLDDYLDYADKATKAHHYRRAIFAYKQALSIYQSDDYAPFIAINLANTYKDIGDYEAAKDTYEAALRLPAAQKNKAMQQEFNRSVVYLRTVEHILASHNITNMPFAKIPPEISAEIESIGKEG